MWVTLMPSPVTIVRYVTAGSRFPASRRRQLQVAGDRKAEIEELLRGRVPNSTSPSSSTTSLKPSSNGTTTTTSSSSSSSSSKRPSLKRKWAKPKLRSSKTVEEKADSSSIRSSSSSTSSCSSSTTTATTEPAKAVDQSPNHLHPTQYLEVATTTAGTTTAATTTTTTTTTMPPEASEVPTLTPEEKEEGKEEDELGAEEPPCNMSMLQKLALTALNLTAPASSVLLHNRRNNWVQLSGHPGSLAPAGPGTIWKKRNADAFETAAYQSLMHDSARDIVPTFFREISYQGEYFIEMADLLYDFHNPSVMDIKMGTRTFLESEVSNTKAREDLYYKMMKVDPNGPSQEEHTAKAVTKLRYMNFRDVTSSSRSLGFRIEALKMSKSEPVTDLKTVQCRDDVVHTMTGFVGGRESTKKQILSRLRHIRNRFESSDFFQCHEVIGSSILIIHDDEKAGVWMIDFAKTLPVPGGNKVSHRSNWKLGNHEEGYLTGIDNLIKVIEDVPVHKSKRLSFFSKS
ncbi:inositol-trisphosphate 3-kinase-like protein isoform X2 [Oratosquilla oratoria]|uniref:inositol-trisphosphate 3-kinase-like protein isoform X2 n=1 Tax=Oratosquilla oratoria TaxID=337810 RepID=UPI003F776A5C